MRGGRHVRSAGEVIDRRAHAQRSRSRWILLGCAMLVGGLVFTFATRGLRIRDLRHKMASSQIAYEQAWLDRALLESELASQDDLSAIEEAIREQLGWVMPGEERVVFIYEEESSPGEGE